ncbi:hypothetical protein B0H66DRAFT_628943 [Apodospora peruviana]|uniref:Uncharacterized protein n=1 Tax=Apodospora peruviana TaxID=516989 RepID=A0AAE0HUT4_9PEZI|nr:hypothetical protein B0H66DRAFT_628943 [Apodospora peruviana]
MDPQKNAQAPDGRRAVPPRTPRRVKPQSIDGRIVDPIKLSALLEQKFGKGAYEVEMRHNRFLVRARSELTDDEIRQSYY